MCGMESVKKALSGDNLVEIPTKNWRELRDLFAPNWPKNHIAWHTINNYINWFRIEPGLENLKIYSLNGAWRGDGTFVVIDCYQLFIYTLELSNEKLKRLLRILDWSHGFKVNSFLKRHRATLLEIIKEKNLKVDEDSITNLYFLSKEEARRKKFLAPNNIVLKPLSTNDAEIVNHDKNNVNADFHLKRMIEWNPNLGAYDLNGELLGWCLRLQSGALGELQVRDKYKRRGIGSLIIIAMCKILVSMSMDSFAFIDGDNLKLQMMFTKFGFRKTDDVYSLKTSAIITNGNGH